MGFEPKDDAEDTIDTSPDGGAHTAKVRTPAGAGPAPDSEAAPEFIAPSAPAPSKRAPSKRAPSKLSVNIVV